MNKIIVGNNEYESLESYKANLEQLWDIFIDDCNLDEMIEDLETYNNIRRNLEE